MSRRLSGRVCVITATGVNMGREAARTFAREGASVAGCGLNVDATQAIADMVRALVSTS
jgi:meso-butanediol dehydrogenase/(S,S)-butanediol dehydrogenase/diacetyl reductase